MCVYKRHFICSSSGPRGRRFSLSYRYMVMDKNMRIEPCGPYHCSSKSGPTTRVSQRSTMSSTSMSQKTLLGSSVSTSPPNEKTQSAPFPWSSTRTLADQEPNIHSHPFFISSQSQNPKSSLKTHQEKTSCQSSRLPIMERSSELSTTRLGSSACVSRISPLSVSKRVMRKRLFCTTSRSVWSNVR